MLEKMGWSKGMGLGANLDGSQEFVRVRFKNDAEGLGYEARDDQWTVHEEGFNGLLKALNGEETNEDEVNGGAASASEDEARPMGFGFKAEPVVAEQAKPKSLKEKISGVSLEEKSKGSKARVHYKKFTRGKDLAQYSEKDLANIFGKKATDAIDFPVVEVTPEPEPEEEEKPLNPNFGGVQTVSTGLSVNDYFKIKMEAMKNRLKNNAYNVGEESRPVNGEDAQPEALVANGTEEQPIKKKKKKKDKEREHEEPVNTEEPQPEANEEQPAKKKKKKKDKEQESEQLIEITEEAAPEQKKKKKSKRAAEDEPAQLEDAVVESEESNPPKRKKKKKDKQDDTEELEPTLPAEETSITESKKKKKSKKTGNTVEEETAESPIQTEEPAKKKSKKNKEVDKEESLADFEPKEETGSKSKRKSKKIDEAQEESSAIEISEESASKSKKKSKRNEVKPQPEASTAAEPISKKKKKNKSKNQEPEVSADDDSSDSSAEADSTVKYLTHKQLLAKLESFNVYTISSFCAEKFHVVDMKRFKNSTLAQIPGYLTDENVKLKIVEVKSDANRIISLWDNRSDKYGKSNGANYQKTNNYYRRITPTAIKAIRRTQAFTGI